MERVLPQTLRIHVVEREPVAQITTTVVRGGSARAERGLPARRRRLRHAARWIRASGPSRLTLAEHYPFITGASPAGLVPGREIESPQIRAALRLVAAFEHSPMAGLVELQRIDVSSPEVLLVTTDQQSESWPAPDDLDRQLNRWRLVHDLGRPAGPPDRLAGSCPWWRTSPCAGRRAARRAARPAPKLKKTSPYKKKHV